jgi:hypothetical protein
LGRESYNFLSSTSSCGYLIVVLSKHEKKVRLIAICQFITWLSPFAFHRQQTQWPNKINILSYLDNELVEKSKALGFNLSTIFENYLKKLINQLSNQQNTQNDFPSRNEASWWAGPDSDRRPSARQADVLTRLDDRPTVKDVCYAVIVYRRFVL